MTLFVCIQTCDVTNFTLFSLSNNSSLYKAIVDEKLDKVHCNITLRLIQM